VEYTYVAARLMTYLQLSSSKQSCSLCGIGDLNLLTLLLLPEQRCCQPLSRRYANSFYENLFKPRHYIIVACSIDTNEVRMHPSDVARY
jgi:hypothetical protein